MSVQSPTASEVKAWLDIARVEGVSLQSAWERIEGHFGQIRQDLVKLGSDTLDAEKAFFEVPTEQIIEPISEAVQVNQILSENVTKK